MEYTNETEEIMEVLEYIKEHYLDDSHEAHEMIIKTQFLKLLQSFLNFSQTECGLKMISEEAVDTVQDAIVILLESEIFVEPFVSRFSNLTNNETNSTNTTVTNSTRRQLRWNNWLCVKNRKH